MTNNSSDPYTDQKIVRKGRRTFLHSALIGGFGSALVSRETLANTNNDSRQVCGELTAAEPLYLYAGLVSQLQPAAILAARETEKQAWENLDSKLKRLWELADTLRPKLISSQPRISPHLEQINTLAHVGRANTQTSVATFGIHPQRTLERENITTQRIVIDQIVRTGAALQADDQKVLSADEWKDLKQILDLIDEVKLTYFPAVVSARITFDSFIKSINKQILSIQDSLIKASGYVLDGQKQMAISEITSAINELKGLPSVNKSVQSDNFNALTRDNFIEMVEANLKLINGSIKLPSVSNSQQSDGTVVFISTSLIRLPNKVLNASSVRSIVREFFVSGNWLQVIGCAAACAPIWAAYDQSDHRRGLILSAISAIPRGYGTKLAAAAEALNKLVS